MKKIVMLCNLILILILLSGCWGKLEINELNVASAIGVDKTENGYKVTAQVVNPSSVAKEGTNRANIVTYSQEAGTVFEALRKMTFLYPSKVFIAHFQLLVFGEELAREGIGPTIHFFFTDHETRQKYDIAIVKEGKAEDVLKIQTPVEKNPAHEIISSMKSAQEQFGTANLIYVDEFITSIKIKDFNVGLTSMKIKGEVKEGSENKNIETADISTVIQIDSLAIMKDDKLMGYLTLEESKGYSRIMNTIKNTVISADFGDHDKVTFEATAGKTKMKLDLSGELPKVTIKHDAEGVIATTKSGKSYFTKKEIKEIEDKVGKVILENMDSCVERVQNEYKSDVFKIGSLIHKKNYKYWRTIEENYDDEIFPKIDIVVEVKVKVLSQAI